MNDADDYAMKNAGQEARATLPLFDDPESDPFEASREAPTADQARIAGIIWRRGGWRNAVSAESLSKMTQRSAREIKSIIEALRNTHKCAIGSRHEAPAGYYRIVNEEDREMAVAPYHSQMLKMWRTLKVLGTRGENQRLLAQMRSDL